MKIGFIGTHSAAKTSTVSYVLQYLKSKDIEDVMIRHECARRSPYPITPQHDFRLTYWIMSESIRTELELEQRCTHLLCDRTVVDQVVYAYDSYRRKQITKLDFALILDTAKLWLRVRPYDITYFFHPMKLKADSVRPLDHSWQETIARYFEWWTPKLLGKDGFINVRTLNLEKRKWIVAVDIMTKIRLGHY